MRGVRSFVVRAERMAAGKSVLSHVPGVEIERDTLREVSWRWRIGPRLRRPGYRPSDGARTSWTARNAPLHCGRVPVCRPP
eukprot:3433224-Prymnesium_polylepis.1